ncbi:MAG: divalent-cation tolerance protein CutA [Desulfobacterales bacterium CG23_combo_of_CG06-09_8_20_14_all_52_9]|nr:MAG: divalent-cation tolerance protein CutA [Desulfobacterales bacterium CG23_combo_of_CG06-09_8_20_14_all_52_9]
MELRWVYITVGNSEEAQAIGKALVESRLAACVNIIDNMHSIYYWEGRLQNDTETVLIAKTTKKKVRRLIEKVKSMHSYECPCIISFAMTEGYPPFLQWIEEQVN